MLKWKKVSLFLFIGLFTINSANSAGKIVKQRTITIMGHRTCSAWIENEKKEKMASEQINGWIGAANDRSWATGVLTGINYASPIDSNPLENINSQILFDWIHKYCIENTQSDVFDGIEKLFDKLEKISKKR